MIRVLLAAMTMPVIVIRAVVATHFSHLSLCSANEEQKQQGPSLTGNACEATGELDQSFRMDVQSAIDDGRHVGVGQ